MSCVQSMLFDVFVSCVSLKMLKFDWVDYKRIVCRGKVWSINENTNERPLIDVALDVI